MTKMSASERYAARKTRSLHRTEERALERVRMDASNARWGQFEPHYWDAWQQVVERYNRAGVV